MATDSTAMDLDSRQNCSTCKTRMSSLMHDSHLICVNCRGCECTLDNRCVECEGWSEEVMISTLSTINLLTLRASQKRIRRSPLPLTRLHFLPLGTLI